jgi:hypothetical protein
VMEKAGWPCQILVNGSGEALEVHRSIWPFAHNL